MSVPRRAFVALGVAAVAGGIAHSAMAADKIRVGLAAPQFTPYAPVYAAEDLGYYKAKGLEAEITVYRGGGPAQEALAAGAADMISFFPPGVALAIQKGVKQKMVAAGGSLTPQGWHLLVTPDSPIRSLKDLADKKVGITSKGATTDFYALWSAKQGGVSVQTVPLGGGGILPALKAKQVDAAVLWPNLSYRMTLGGEARSLVDFGASMEPNLPEVWVASQAAIDGKPEMVRRFLEAVMKATKHMQDNRAFGIDYIKKYTKEENDKAVELAYESITRNSPTDGVFTEAVLKRSLELAALAGVTGIPDVKELYTDKFMPVNPN
jgi:NitT/TauT family transport system substrate-binding protein